jgi:hypothetical protein
MLVMSRIALLSLVKAVNRDEIPKSIVDHWFIVHGKQVEKKEVEELERDEKRI